MDTGERLSVARGLIGVVLVVGTLAVFWPVGDFEFLGYDDYTYVYENTMVQQGWTAESIAWAFTATHASNWHPLTWLSHMLDWTLFGSDAGAHHWVNALIHAINALLVFLIFERMTGARWAAAFVAAVFALHPLHVESVAWVAERKDVLSTLFWMLTIAAYVRYAERPGVVRYAATLCCLALGLLAKPMLVTLPFVLLLLDLWPLGRLTSAGRLGRLVLEKVPLLALSAISSAATYAVQSRSGAVRSFETIPFADRVANAVVSYATYAIKTIWPAGLAVPYPFTAELPVWQVLAAALFLVSASVATLTSMRNRPFLAVGWFWFLGTLVPVIGLIQVGSQARADRYTYVPMIGLLIVIAWGLPALIPGRFRRPTLVLLGAAGLIACTVLTSRQLPYWRNTETLFQRVLAITIDNRVAHYNLGLYLSRRDRPAEAIPHYREALRIEPDYYDAHWNLGNLLFRQGRGDEAAAHFREVLHQNPNSVQPMTKLAAITAQSARPGSPEAAEAVRFGPEGVCVE